MLERLLKFHTPSQVDSALGKNNFTLEYHRVWQVEEVESGVIVSVRQIHTYVAAFGKVTSHLLPLKKARRWFIVKSSTEPPFYIA